VLLVHPAQCPAAALAVVAPLHQFTDDQIGVVVAFLRAGAELTGPVQQCRDAGHAEAAEQGEFERARRVEREIVAGAEEHDPLVVPLWVERPDLFQYGWPRHDPERFIENATARDGRKSRMPDWGT
jgi:hypothetical protein